MSVSFPVIRKQQERPETPGQPKHSHNRDRRRLKAAVYITVLLGLAGALYFGYIAASISARPKVLAVIADAQLMGVYDTGFIISNQEHTVFLDVNGITSTMPRSFEYFLVAGTSIIGVDPPLMHLIRPNKPGVVHRTVHLAPEERPVPMTGGDIVLTFKPQSSIKFGETWALCALSQEGACLWKQVISYAPFIAACSEQRLIIGAIDISGGGTPWMICLSRHTGQKLWEQPLDAGVWRHLSFCPDGKISAVLDSAAYSFTCEGEALWVHTPGSRIVSAVYDCNVSAIATVSNLPGTVAKVLGATRIDVIGEDGKVRWSKVLQDRLPRLFIWKNHLIVLGSASASCYRLRDGHKLVPARIDGYPITCVKDVILIYKDRSLTLVDPGILKSVR